MRLTIRDLDKLGVVPDVDQDTLPLNAWLVVKNGKCDSGVISKAQGMIWKSYQNLLLKPEWLVPYLDPESGAFFWIYPGVDNQGNFHIATWDGTSHVLRTRDAELANNSPSDPGYTRIPNTTWTGGILNGLVYVNSGGDVPQKWDRTSGVLKDDFEDFANWPSNTTARVMRSFRNFIMAYDITDTTGRRPYTVMWSDEAADPFTEPLTWTPGVGNRAGSTEVSEEGGYLIDSLPLRGSNIIYRESASLLQRFIGGNNVFQFDPLFRDIGLLAPRCVKAFKGRHFVVSAGDIYVHDGNSFDSVATNRVKKQIFEKEIDPTYYRNSFVVPNYAKEEMWFFYPSRGFQYPKRAAVWNWRNNTWSFRELYENAAHVGYGYIPEAGQAPWDDVNETWDTYNVLWDSSVANPVWYSLLLAHKGVVSVESSLTHLDVGYTRVNRQFYHTMFLRQSIGEFVSDEGSRIPPTVDKAVNEVWIDATGGPFKVSVGGANTPSGPYKWTAPQYFTPGVTKKIGVRGINHKFLALKIEDESTSPYSISKIIIDFTPGGSR